MRHTHCDVVAYIDAPARKMYVIGGNVYQSVTVKKLNLSGRDLKFSAVQKAIAAAPAIGPCPRRPAKPQAPLTTMLAQRQEMVRAAAVEVSYAAAVAVMDQSMVATRRFAVASTIAALLIAGAPFVFAADAPGCDLR